MQYDCNKLTNKLKSLQNNHNELRGFLSGRKASLAKILQSELKGELEPLLKELDVYQIRIREEIAKKYGFKNVEILSNGQFLGISSDDIAMRDFYYLIDNENKEILQSTPEFVDMGNGTFLIKEINNIDDQRESIFGIVISNGEYIKHFSNFYDIEKDPEELGQPVLMVTDTFDHSFINTNGEEILVNIGAEEDSEFHEDMIWIENNLGFKLYDSNGTLVKEFTNQEFDEVSNFSGGFAAGVNFRSSGMPTSFFVDVYFIDKTGNRTKLDISLVEHVEERTLDSFEIIARGIFKIAGIDPFTKERVRYYFNKDGVIFKEEVVKPSKRIAFDSKTGDFITYDLIYENQTLPLEPNIISINNKGENIDVQGLGYWNVVGFSEGFLLITTTDGTCVFLDENYNFNQLDTKYNLEEAELFENGFARVLDEKGWFVIDKKGKDRFKGKRFHEIEEVKHGIATVATVYTSDFKKHYIDIYGNEIFQKAKQ